MAPTSCRNRFVEHAEAQLCLGAGLQVQRLSKWLARWAQRKKRLSNACIWYPDCASCQPVISFTVCLTLQEIVFISRAYFYSAIHNVLGQEKTSGKKFKICSLFTLVLQFSLQEEIYTEVIS